MKSRIAAAGFAAVMALGSGAASAASIIDLVVEGGGTVQVFALDNGNFLGLWGFDNRRAGATDVTVSSAQALIDGFVSGGGSIVAFYNGTNPVNPGASEFDPLEFGFTVAAGARLFDSLWIEWTGGDIVYAGTRTMGSGTITREGDPFSPMAPIPLPAAGWLLLGGLAGLGLLARRRETAAA